MYSKPIPAKFFLKVALYDVCFQILFDSIEFKADKVSQGSYQSNKVASLVTTF